MAFSTGAAHAAPAPVAPTDADPNAPVHLIIDTDAYSDVDDAGALAIANAAQDNGKADILGVMVDTPSKWGAPAVDAINTYYGHGNIPIGTLKPNDDSTFTKNYAQVLAQQFPNSLKTGTKAPDAVSLYRKILAKQPDHSVTIAAIGLETNLANLLDSGPDQFSDLNGSDLVAQKVKELDVMGGQYPSGHEFNFFSDPGATQRVVNDWPGRVVFDGFEVGVSVFTGSRMFTETPPTNPVRKAYEIYVGAGNNRNSWDPSNVFYAINGMNGLFTLGGDTGSNHVEANGSNEWVASPNKDQNYLVKTTEDSTIARALSDLMVQPPRRGPNAPDQHSAPVHVILDTDIYSDVDDVGALAIANAAQDNGKIDLLGVMVDTPSKWGAPAVDAINTYYGHGNIPVGALKPNDDSTWTKNYTQHLAQEFPNSLHTGENAPDAVSLYRKILAKQPDHSVTIAAVGYENNLAGLLDSGPDQFSDLNGYDLVTQKVKVLTVMGGNWNFGNVSAPPPSRESVRASAVRVVNDWPTRVVFNNSPGGQVFTGSRLFTETPPNDPVRKAYEIYVGYGKSRNSWDPANLLYDSYGADGLMSLIGDQGAMHVNEDGTSAWADSPDKDQNEVVRTVPDSTFARALEDLMVQPPAHDASGADTTAYRSPAEAFDNVGVSDDADHAPGNFDGVGNSYSAQALAAEHVSPGATITARGIGFTWPDVPTGSADNIIARGQSIAVRGSGSTLGFLGAATSGTHSGTGTVRYADGTTTPFTLTFADWISSTPAPDGDVVATTTYFNRSTPGPNRAPSVFAAYVPLQDGKRLSAVTLPDDPRMHVFALAVG